MDHLRVLERQRAICSVRSLLGQQLLITIQDTRSFMGTFVCTDRDRNIILANADEFRKAEDEGESRYVGMIMIPWKHVVDVSARLAEVQQQGYI